MGNLFDCIYIRNNCNTSVDLSISYRDLNNKEIVVETNIPPNSSLRTRYPDGVKLGNFFLVKEHRQDTMGGRLISETLIVFIPHKVKSIVIEKLYTIVK